MAWTQADVDTLKEAIAGGEKAVRFEGRGYVEYRSLDEMMAVLRMMEAEVAAATPDPLKPPVYGSVQVRLRRAGR